MAEKSSARKVGEENGLDIMENDTEVRTNAGIKLDPPVKFTWRWKAFRTAEQVKAANRWPDDSDIVAYVNDLESAKVRSKEQTKAFDAAGIVKQTAQNNDQIALREFTKNLRTARNADGTPMYTEEQARAMASQMLGKTWATE